MHTTKKSFWVTLLLLSLLTFDFASVVSHYIATYDIHSFLLPYISQLSSFLHSLQMIGILRQMKKFLVGLMIRLSISGMFLGNNNKSYKYIFPFDESISLFLDSFFWRKLAILISFLIFCSFKSFNLYILLLKLLLE